MRYQQWREVATAFLKIGAMSYGGPAILGVIQQDIQARRNWVSRERFVEGLALVNMLPGPLAAQLSIFLGYSRLGWLGGVLAGVCFILPAFFIMLALTVIYSRYGAIPAMRGVFYGLSPVVIGIFAVATYRLGKSAIKDAKQVVIAIASLTVVALTPFGIVPTIVLAGAIGVALYASRPWGTAIAVGVALLFTARFWGGAWLPAIPLLPVGAAAEGSAPTLWNLGVFFLKVGAFTFGGGLAILAFVQDQVVNQLHWLSPTEFLDGLALGQITPGPIVMLAAFVGYQVAGAWGAAVSGAAIFLPSFLMILSAVPVLDRLKRIRWMGAALKGISPAVIGMIAAALLDMLPHAVLDLPTLILSLATIIAIIVWRVSPLPAMAAGGAIGALLKAR